MNLFSIALIVFMTVLLLIGDYLIKKSVGSNHVFLFLCLAGAFWCSSIAGWYYLMVDHRIAIVGMLFAIFSLVGSVILGMVFFGEHLSVSEWIGMALAIVASILLSGKG